MRRTKDEVPVDQAWEMSFPTDRWVKLPGTNVEVLWFERVGQRWLQYRTGDVVHPGPGQETPQPRT